MTPNSPFTDVPTAIEEIRAGRMIVVVDDEDRENEGDLTLAAEKVTPAAINFMARYGRGLVCLAMTEERLEQLAHRAYDQRKHLAIRNRFLRSYRRPRRRDDRHLRSRSRPHHQSGDRSEDPSLRSGPARPHVPAARPKRWSAGARRPDRSLGRPGSPGRHGSRWNHLRNHERRRHHGPRARPYRASAAPTK